MDLVGKVVTLFRAKASPAAPNAASDLLIEPRCDAFGNLYNILSTKSVDPISGLAPSALTSFDWSISSILAANLASINALDTNSQVFVLSAINLDKVGLVALPDDLDNLSVYTDNLLGTVSRLQAFDGTFYARLRVASAAVQASFAAHKGIQAIAMAGNWAIQHDPAANTQATISRAAGGVVIRHICTSIHATFSAGATAGAAVKVYLRDGATGVGAILWSGSLAVAIGGTANLALSGLSIVGSANAAMTLEFASAGGLTTFENVSLTGYTVA